MGAWGYGLFQSDADLDVCQEISSEAAKLTKDPEFELFYPEDRVAVVNKLNAGILDQLFIDFQAAKWDHGVIYLGALAMQLGARVTLKQIATLHKTLKRTSMYDEAKAQMQNGLNQYKNDAQPFDFGSLGVHDTMAKSLEQNKGKAKEGPKAPIMLNVMEDWGKMAQPKPKVVSKENQPPKRGKKAGKKGAEKEAKKEAKEPMQAKEPTGKDGLGDKATLKSWLDTMGKDTSI